MISSNDYRWLGQIMHALINYRWLVQMISSNN